MKKFVSKVFSLSAVYRVGQTSQSELINGLDDTQGKDALRPFAANAGSDIGVTFGRHCSFVTQMTGHLRTENIEPKDGPIPERKMTNFTEIRVLVHDYCELECCNIRAIWYHEWTIFINTCFCDEWLISDTVILANINDAGDISHQLHKISVVLRHFLDILLCFILQRKSKF